MAPKLALLDVDGTLRHERTWHPGAVELLRTLGEAGLDVALCSGRPTRSMRILADELPEVSLLGACSGGAVWAGRDDWRLLEDRPLPPEAIEAALDACHRLGGEVWAFTADEWIVERETEGTRHEEWIVGFAPRITPIVSTMPIVKLLFFLTDPADADDIRAHVTTPGVRLVQSGPRYLDVVREDVFQAKGGDVILDHLGRSWAETIAIGDNENDLGMLSRAGTAVVVGEMGLDRLGPAPDGGTRVAVEDTAAALDWCRQHLG